MEGIIIRSTDQVLYRIPVMNQSVGHQGHRINIADRNGQQVQADIESEFVRRANPAEIERVIAPVAIQQAINLAPMGHELPDIITRFTIHHESQ